MADFNVDSTPISINGQPLGGGFSFGFDLGGTTADYANQAYAFLANNQNQNQIFLSQSMAGTQSFLAHQLNPLSTAIANTQNQNAAMIPIAIQRFNSVVANQQAYLNNLATSAINTIQSNTYSTNQANQNIAESNSGSLICTELYKREIISFKDYRYLSVLYGYIRKRDSSKLIKYQRRAKRIIKHIRDCRTFDIYETINTKFIRKIVEFIKLRDMQSALDYYVRMMYYLTIKVQ